MDEVTYYNIMSSSAADRKDRKMLANHLRYDHEWPLHKIQQRLGISRKDLKEILGEDMV